ncbi:hypothetical protein AK830_g3331 [Neonectria ditissima]|uniref:LysM domain-containing protein n=1 Tax=Neonectria ditissima TaxID=78410 RepID=A0A0N8H802_9HYPO|nr:hypothetical protein AK830_g3331 [Neonectria ditissima]
MSVATAILALLAVAPASGIKVWDTPGDIPTTIPAKCRVALSSNLECGPRLVRPAELASLGSLSESLLTQYCNSTCTASMKTWTEKVDLACGSEVHDWGFNLSQSGDDVTKPLFWAHQASCLTDEKSDEYCIPKIANHTVNTCSDCTLKYLASFVGSSYAPDIIDDTGFSKLLTSCSADASDYPILTPTAAIPTSTPTERPTKKCRGTSYTVKADDNCTTIADSFGVAIDRFLTENGIDAKCQSLEKGDSICIGLACDLHKVAPLSDATRRPELTSQQLQPNETCRDLIRDYGFSLTEFLSWNPIVHPKCDNLAALKGRTICVSPPGEDKYEGPPQVTWSTSKTALSGDWQAAPTAGSDASNSTVVETKVIPTVTITGNATRATEYHKYVRWCPIDDEVGEQGFRWENLDEKCQDMLEPYCSPEVTGEPLPSTKFPSSCLPSVVLGLDTKTETSVSSTAETPKTS